MKRSSLGVLAILITLLTLASPKTAIETPRVCLTDYVDSQVPKTRGTVLTDYKWSNGTTLDISFLDGEEWQHDIVKKYAVQWEEYANIKFNYVNNNNSTIRISFEEGRGSWSYIGTISKQIPFPEPTMILGWLSKTNSRSNESLVLHEFGHALGMVHEQSNPDSAIPWNKPYTYQYYKECCNWSQSEVDYNIFFKYTESETQFSIPDLESIMHYPIDNQFTIGDFEVPWTYQLSNGDKAFISSIYPKDNGTIPKPNHKIYLPTIKK